MCNLSCDAPRLGNIPENQHCAQYAPTTSLDGRRRVLDVILLPIPTQQETAFGRHNHVILFQALGYWARQALAFFIFDKSKDLICRAGPGLSNRPARKRLGHGVHVSDDSLRIGRDNSVGDRTKRGLSPISFPDKCVLEALSLGNLLLEQVVRSRQFRRSFVNSPFNLCVGPFQLALSLGKILIESEDGIVEAFHLGDIVLSEQQQMAAVRIDGSKQ
jgi:hypothetical protein